MKTQINRPLDFEIDKLTNSIENVISGEKFDTNIIRLGKADGREIKKGSWSFNWHKELEDADKLVFKIVTINNPLIIHGLICITDKRDHIFMDLIESAKFNRGKNKLYHGIAGNLVAFACKTAFELRYNGVVSFMAKTQLIEHYKNTLGAKLFSGNRMFIDTREATVLVKQYFKDFRYDRF